MESNAVVGREVELEEVRSALRDGVCVLVLGPPGIGKTTVVRAALADHPEPVHLGAGVDFLSHHAYLPLATALGRPPHAGDAAAVAAEVARHVGDGVLFLDDLQWADDDSLACIPFLAEGCALAVAARTGTRTATRLQKDVPPGSVVIELGPLSDDASLELLRSRTPHGDDERRRIVADRAAGHPLSLEILGLDDDPDRSADPRRSIRTVMEELSVDERRLLVELRWRLPVLPSKALDQLIGSGLVRTDSHGHPGVLNDVLGELALETLDPGEQRRLHREAAQRAGDPTEAVPHWLAAGDTVAAHDAAVEAARRTTGRDARADLLAIAARTAPDSERLEAMRTAVTALLRVGRPDVACDLMDELVDDDDLLPPADWIGCQTMRVMRELNADNLTEARTISDATLARCDGSHPQLEYHAWTARAGVLAASFDVAGGRQACEAAFTLAREHRLTATRARAIDVVLAALQGHGEDVFPTVMELLDAAPTDPEPHIAFELGVQVAHAGYLNLARESGVFLVIERMRKLAHALNHRSWLVECDAIDAFHRAFLDFGSPAARSELRRVLADPAVGSMHARLAAVLAVAEADHGDFVAAADALARGHGRRPDVTGRRALDWAAAEIGWLAGQPVEIDPAPARTADLINPLPPCHAVVRRWVALDASNDVKALPHPVTFLPALTGLAAESGAIERVASGRDGDAARELLEAATIHDDYLHRNALRCRWAAADALARSGDRARAVELLDELIAECRESGRSPYEERIRSSLRRLGTRSAAESGRHADRRGPLTARQTEVLELVGQGLSSKAIAARLHLQPRTVDSHIAAAMKALGARTRGEAALRVARDDGPS